MADSSLAGTAERPTMPRQRSRRASWLRNRLSTPPSLFADRAVPSSFVESPARSVPTTPDAMPEPLSPRASCSSWHCSACNVGGEKAPRPRRLVWCLDATGRDGNLVDRLLHAHTPSVDSIEESYLAVLPRMKTNIMRLHEQLRDADVTSSYYAGCGATPRRKGEWLPCTTGSDWFRIVAAAYRDLLYAYDFGDPIVLIGFSRGALACRAIAQILETIGLVPLCTVVDGRPCEEVIAEALQAYDDLFHSRRRKQARATILACSLALNRVRAGKPGTTPSGGTLVEALFVFDTVQSFWFPRCLGFSGGQGVWQRMFGYEAEIVPPNVRRAFHACALSEHRIDYPLTPLVASSSPPADSVLLELREVHFSGSHSDIGGGLLQRDLADIALGWMACQIDRTVPGLIPSPSFDPTKPNSRFWLDLCEGHIDSYGTLTPHTYPVKLSDGFELVCSIVNRPRPVHFAKTLHASVPESSRPISSADAPVIVAPLEPAELLIRSRWALEDDSARSHRTIARNTRKMLRWAETTDVKIAAAGRYATAAIGTQIGHARHGLGSARHAAIGHADAAFTSARTQFDLARHHLHRISATIASPPSSAAIAATPPSSA